MARRIFPKEYIREVLVEEMEDIVGTHAYLSFFLMCAGIEFLGICIDDSSDWFDIGKSKSHYTNAVEKLFPSHYGSLKDTLYKNLRCGLLHCQLPRGYSLAELKNFPQAKYEEHLIGNKELIIVEYFYKDFVCACNKVVSMNFPSQSKMNKAHLKVD